MHALTHRFNDSHAIRCLAAAGLASILTACATAAPQTPPQPQSQAEATTIEAQRRDALAAQAAAEAAHQRAPKPGSELANNMRSMVVPVHGDALQVSNALNSSLGGSVRTYPLGSSVVITGEPQAVEVAVELLSKIDVAAMQDRDRRQDEAMKQAEQLQKEAERRIAASDRIFNVKLGPTLEDSLNSISNALAEASGQGLNIVFTGNEDAKLPVRVVELRRVTLGSAIRTLQSMQFDPNAGPRVVIEVGRQSNPQERPVVTVSPGPQARRMNEDAAYHMAVFRMDALADQASPEDMARVQKQHKSTLEAIDVGLEIAGRSPEFKIKIHPETGMMFVHGTPAELRVVAEVLGVDDPLATPRPFGQAPSAAPAQLPVLSDVPIANIRTLPPPKK